MIFSTSTGHLSKKFGLIKAIEMIIEAGYPAIDLSMYYQDPEIFGDNYLEVAKTIRKMADDAGVRFVQAHAPFSSKRDISMNEKYPLFPRAFEFCSIVGVESIVVHPIQNGRYYGREREHFEFNVEYYKSLAPLAKKYNVNIAIENMWQTHPVTHHICDDVLAPPEELSEMYDRLKDYGCFTVCLDVGHGALCGREPENMIRQIGGERLGCIHLHDVDYLSDRHMLPGTEKLNWKNICQALVDVDYKGSFNLEADNFYLGFPESHYVTVTKFMADTARAFVEYIEELKKN